ncbi:MAG: biopolymer transporter ExbD [Cytophagales bacterium]|nr:biopolymer transporter ExbD [Cytophagales bacterium]
MLTRPQKPTINSGSMADIAFLLLIFFLVTTTIKRDKGLLLKLPPPPEKEVEIEIHERNLFNILINANDQYLIEGEIRSDLKGISEEIKTFVLNKGLDPNLSDSPKDAIVSIKASRGTKYSHFIIALDETKKAYYEIYAGRVGLTPTQYLSLNHQNVDEYGLYRKGKDGIPMNISIAEPD